MPEGIVSVAAKSRSESTAAKTAAKDTHLSQHQNDGSANSGLSFFLSMQRTFGNQATQQLLRAYLANSAPLAQPDAVERQPIHGVIQRMPIRYNSEDNALDTFVETLDEIVQEAAVTARDNPEELADDGYEGLWKDTAAILADRKRDGLDADELAEYNAATRFAPARYGYAVESVSSRQTELLQGALGHAYSFQLQASRGMTRPDIVVTRLADNSEVGWFDITSEGQKEHIFKKTGSGWKTKPYVFEITYPTLDPTKIGTGKKSIAEKVRTKNAYKRRVQAWQSKIGFIKTFFENHWTLQDGKNKNKKDQQDLAKSILANYIGETDILPEDAKSLLRLMEFDIKKFGFTSGGTKARGETILREQEAF